MMTLLTHGTHLITITPQNAVIRFSIDCTRPVKIYTTGTFDTYCTIYNLDLDIVAAFDDYNGLNFSFEVPSNLAFGNYYIDVSLYQQRAINAQFNLIVEYATPPPIAYDFELQNRRVDFIAYDFELQNRRVDFIAYEFLLKNNHYEYADIEIINGRNECRGFDFAFKNTFVDTHDFEFKNALRFAFDLDVQNKRATTIGRDIKLTNVLVDVLSFDFDFKSQVGITPLFKADFRLLNVREALCESVVIDVHTPETPIYGSY